MGVLRDIRKDFLYHTIPELNSCMCDMDYIKFVFDFKDIEELEKIVREDSENFDIGIKSIRHLLSNNKNYMLDNDTYIKVNDMNKFFSLLDQIVIEYSEREHKVLPHNRDFIRGIWLRMGVEDITNVEEFLERQLDFLKHDNIIRYNDTLLSDSNLKIYYKNKCNDEYFETNNHLEFTIKDDDKEYDLPVIHYAFSKDSENKPLCYLYGIQKLDEHSICDSSIKEELNDIRKLLRNKYVSQDFILVLALFMDLLKTCGIDEIRVPLYQVFNYSFHERLSKNMKEAYDSYDKKSELEEKILLGEDSELVLDYIHDKKMYEKFYNKEDLISKNKTERLVNTIISESEILGNIRIVNDPMVEGDTLIIKIDNYSKIIDMIGQKKKAH